MPPTAASLCSFPFPGEFATKAVTYCSERCSPGARVWPGRWMVSSQIIPFDHPIPRFDSSHDVGHQLIPVFVALFLAKDEPSSSGIMGYHGISWDIMGYYGISWDIMGGGPETSVALLGETPQESSLEKKKSTNSSNRESGRWIRYRGFLIPRNQSTDINH